MSTNCIPFAFDSALVRVIMDDRGEPWFVAKDIALALGYQWAGIRNVQHVPAEWRGVESVSTPSAVQEMHILSEQGLYFFLGRSDKPGALPFQKWLAGEVLPTIRKTGSYTLHEQARPALPPKSAEPALPDVPEMLNLRPAMRQRLWRDALQTARLDDGDSAVALKWFRILCRMVAATPAPPLPARDKVAQFVAECCQRADGCRISAAELYAAFVSWHKGKSGDTPSKRAFGTVMQDFARSLRSNGSYYEGLHLKTR
ncbi:hypothetical protein IG626_02155 [Desulfovibrio desulfuricans]|uniref:BRO-N domain-containing protein n=1 Tax=Desulfovibrio desulfuricans TaxID=876 RepID=UPI00177F56E0|nr:BRO family protein [Desulfovibrio desulfuricans]MBD8894793.1 hypothetical protein [Desulfovibrio desulfuricans]